jgi:signal transduction histidine kinase
MAPAYFRNVAFKDVVYRASYTAKFPETHAALCHDHPAVRSRTHAARARLGARRIHRRRGPHPSLVHGDPDALECAVANLVDNAVKWSPSGGLVRIRVQAGTLDVADAGKAEAVPCSSGALLRLTLSVGG